MGPVQREGRHIRVQLAHCRGFGFFAGYKLDYCVETYGEHLELEFAAEPVD